MSATNIITASFNGRRETWASRHLWQWDYGQVLQLPDLELPDNYQVHFSNYPIGGQAYVVLGNAGGVSIPDTLLTSGLPVYAYVFLQSGADDGETVYKVFIPVDPRPRPSEDPPTPAQQSALDEAIAALNAATEDIQGQIDNALQEAKDSGEFDGADGNQIWWTEKSITPSPMMVANTTYFSGGSGSPKAGDYLIGPPAGSATNDPSYLYSIIQVSNNLAMLSEIGSIKGADGEDGQDGADGADGNSLWQYDPSALANIGSGTDMYFDKSHLLGRTSVEPQIGDIIYYDDPITNRTKAYQIAEFVVVSSTTQCRSTYLNYVTGASGSSGTSDYTDLSNKPSINNVTLDGNKTSANLGLEAAGTCLPKAGGTMTGAIAMGGYKVTGLAAGTANTDAVNKKQMEDAIADLGEVLDFKGAVQDVSDLPSTGNRGGDVYLVRSLGAMFVWAETGTGGAYEWDEMGEHVDLSGYIEKPSSPTTNDLLTWNGSAWVGAPAVTEVTNTSTGDVTLALDAGKIYHFTGAISSLTLTLNAPASGQLAQYHFDFDSGSTAATVSITGVTWQGGNFTPSASKHYEVDILNGYGVVCEW